MYLHRSIFRKVFGVCVANAFGFVGWAIFHGDISGSSDPRFSVYTLAFCRKEPTYFKPSCLNIHEFKFNLKMAVINS